MSNIPLSSNGNWVPSSSNMTVPQNRQTFVYQSFSLITTTPPDPNTGLAVPQNFSAIAPQRPLIPPNQILGSPLPAGCVQGAQSLLPCVPSTYPMTSTVPMTSNNQTLGFPGPVVQENVSLPPCNPIAKLIVCDTNIYMESRDDIEKIVSSNQFKLAIPKKIHKELDKLKNHDNGKSKKAKKARDATKYIAFILKHFPQKVHCQNSKGYDEAKNLFAAEDSDDSILQAVLQLQNAKIGQVFLHTLDLNLRNQAVGDGIRLFELESLLMH